MEKKPDYMVLVNGENRLPENFEDTIELVMAENMEGVRYPIEKKTYEAFLRLRQDMLENEGMQIELVSVYRTVATQERIWELDEKKYGLEYTKKFVAVPGHSEHHTGFAIDVSIVVDGKLVHGMPNLSAIDHLYQFVQQKLPKYGFILRYPKDKEAITKIGYEPWHFRYIDSPEIAREITDRGICFEDFWEERK